MRKNWPNRRVSADFYYEVMGSDRHAQKTVWKKAITKRKTNKQASKESTRSTRAFADIKIMITFRQCGGNHLTIMCPLRTPGERPKSWKQQQDEFYEHEESKPYKCTAKMHPGKMAIICSASIDEFWRDIRVTFNHSL